MSNVNFLNIGKTLQELSQEEKLDTMSISNDVLPLGIKMPLERGSKSYESLFKMNTSVFDQISNNFKFLLKTKASKVVREIVDLIIDLVT